ncbi:signal peptidase I [Pseudomonas marginalis]|uniref:signal peptidase I n=1 Tax=Pseudomonas marginalis TaxID=298 RepID=UPI0005FB7743|nr:signal peptidase I [Pseudomonas marginalis]KJZ52313.1 hypothetical protein VC37_20605 [Pseudomonas marginalis]KJZ57803.1 hypothetical protein VC36_17370 [Pseudomonas marginalis]
MDLDFSLVLCAVLAVTGIAKILDFAIIGKRPGIEAPAVISGAANNGVGRVLSWAVYGVRFLSSLFAVILVVFIIRSFIVEPFKIPSDSMLPTLESGDFILVNKFAYGLHIPVMGTKILSHGIPERGDVIVFRYPQDPRIHYIKRIVGLPGDTVAYRDNQLFVNGVKIAIDLVPGRLDTPVGLSANRYSETLGIHPHDIYVNPRGDHNIYPVWKFPHIENCIYGASEVSCQVPAGYYFGMGDNRDNSADSRYWGFVPEANIEGNAFAVWLNFRKLGRIGLLINSLRPSSLDYID